MTPSLVSATTELQPFVPVLVYLLAVCAALAALDRVPVLLHPVALVAGLTVHTVSRGWREPALTSAVALLIFVLLVYFAAQMASGSTLFTLSTAVALGPTDIWPGLMVALLVAAVVSVVRTWRATSKSRVLWLAMDTVGAIGVSASGLPQKPNASLVPSREDLAATEPEGSSAGTMYLPPYLLAGVVVATACVVLL